MLKETEEIRNMNNDNFEKVYNQVKTMKVVGSFFKIIDAWTERCQELGRDILDIPKIMEDRRRSEIRSRSLRGRKFISYSFFWEMD
mgnify:CR=1 FL=1